VLALKSPIYDYLWCHDCLKVPSEPMHHIHQEPLILSLPCSCAKNCKSPTISTREIHHVFMVKKETIYIFIYHRDLSKKIQKRILTHHYFKMSY
jgi:hypothetical protein